MINVLLVEDTDRRNLVKQTSVRKFFIFAALRVFTYAELFKSMNWGLPPRLQVLSCKTDGKVFEKINEKGKINNSCLSCSADALNSC